LVEAYYNAIARFRPHGPYRLAGLSFGGILAMELASKMRKSGAEVELVILLDAVLPQAVHHNWAKWISYQVTEILEGKGPKKLRALVATIQDRAAKRWSELTIRQDEKYGHEAFRIGQQAAYLVAAERWRARQFLCDFQVVLFRATDSAGSRPYLEIDDDLGWRRYLGDRLTIVDAIGGHRGIIEPPNVTELGRKAQEFLGSGFASW